MKGGLAQEEEKPVLLRNRLLKDRRLLLPTWIDKKTSILFFGYPRSDVKAILSLYFALRKEP